jgi:hypothetical protein
MKNNLIKALVLSLDYELKTYSTRNFCYELEKSYGDYSLIITVMPSETGCFHDLQSIYPLLHDRLCTHARVHNGNLVITVF